MSRGRFTCITLVVLLSATMTACSSSNKDGVLFPSDISGPVDGPNDLTNQSTGDTAQATSDALRCGEALTAFSAVSNVLMSGLSKPSSFDLDRYEANLTLTQQVSIPAMELAYLLYVEGYLAAGVAVAASKDAGGPGTAKGAIALDQASAVLSDDSLTEAAKEVATFLVNGCRSK